MNLKEAHELLGIPQGASKDEAKKAFRKLAQKLHPDINKEPDAEAKFKKINEAYQLVENGEKEGFSNFQGINFNDLGDLFRSQRPTKTFHIEDKHIYIDLSFKESILGTNKEIKYNRNAKCGKCDGKGSFKTHNGCKTCNGSGTVTKINGNVIMRSQCRDCRGKANFNPCQDCKEQGTVNTDTSISVTIPPGITTDNVLRLGNMGDFAGEGFFGGEAYSNVFVHMNIEKHVLSLEENDVVANLNISLLEALQGTKKSIETIDGPKEIDIPSLIKNKEEVILPKLGVARMGNQRVIINIDYPKDIQPLINILNASSN